MIDGDQYRDRLRKRIRFLLPTPVAVALMIGWGFMASDAVATGYFSGLFSLFVLEAVLVWNILARSRMQRKLNRLLAVHCIVCDYDLSATPDRCPECGTVSPAKG